MLTKHLLLFFYKSIVQIVLSFCITAWGRNCGLKDKKAFGRTIKRASKFTIYIDSFDDIFQESSLRKINKIIENAGHPLNSFAIKSSRSKRLLSIPYKSNRHLNSFIPHSVRLYNSNSMRSHNRFSRSDGS